MLSSVNGRRGPAVVEYRVALEVVIHDFEDAAALFHEYFDGMLVERAGKVVATVYADAEDGVSAAVSTVRELEEAGFSVVRTDPDLVDSPEIAARLSCTRQAVNNYAKGTRGSGFPRPIGSPGGKRIWTWGQITEWLTGRGELTEPPSLTLDDAAKVDAYLAHRRSAAASARMRVDLGWAVFSGSVKGVGEHIVEIDDYPERHVRGIYIEEPA